MYQAYYNCRNLTGSPVCGNNVTKMCDTYYNCRNLTGAAIVGANVTNIINAYTNCNNLTNIVVHPLLPPVATNAFDGIPETVPIYVHLEALGVYRESPTWSSYVTRLKSIEPFGNIVFLTKESVVTTLLNTNSDISINYLSPESNTPTVNIVSDNTNIATVSNITVTEFKINFTINSLTTEGSATITVTATTSDGETNTFTLVVNVYEKLPTSYSVQYVDGATYGFTLNEDGYYESTNNGVDKSYSICKVNITTDGISKVYFDCINSGENNYDFGILSNVDSTLTLDYTEDSANVFKSFKGSSNTSVQTVDYGVLTEGEHFVYVKYRKDSSASSDNDSLQFKVRFE